MDPNARPRMDERFPLLLRGDRAVQLGTSTERAVVVHPPDGIAAERIADLLRGLDGTRSLRDALRRTHLDYTTMAPLLAELLRCGLLDDPGERARSTGTIAVLGSGILAERMHELISGIGGEPLRIRSIDALPIRRAQAVVLTDNLVIDPDVRRILHAGRLPHMHVHLQDGAGLISPLIIPGRTACLHCQELHRRDADPEWPRLLIQQLGLRGRGEAAVAAATAAVAAERVRSSLSYLSSLPDRHDNHGPATAGPRDIDGADAGAGAGAPAPGPWSQTAIEVDPRSARIRTIPRAPHPWCGCRTGGSPVPEAARAPGMHGGRGAHGRTHGERSRAVTRPVTRPSRASQPKAPRS